MELPDIFRRPEVKESITLALREDLGELGVDVTTESLVPPDARSTMGVVMDQVIRSHNAHARHGNGRSIASGPACDVVNLVIPGVMAAGRQGPAISARQQDAAVTSF